MNLVEFNKEPNKYGYSHDEEILMVFTSAVSNIVLILPIILLSKKEMIYQAYLFTFTFLTSFMYHFTESINAKSIFMTEDNWHILDNIGSIMSFVTVIINVGNFKNYSLDTHLNLFGLYMVIFLQMADAWNLSYTVAPIVFFGSLILYLSFYYDTKIFSNNMSSALSLIFISIGVIFFFKSQNQYQDYLRIYHGCWHIFVALSAFYGWQTNEAPGDHVQIMSIFSKNPQKLESVYQVDVKNQIQAIEGDAKG